MGILDCWQAFKSARHFIKVVIPSIDKRTLKSSLQRTWSCQAHLDGQSPTGWHEPALTAQQ